MIQKLHIFDFDGTLVDSSHRYRTNPETGKIDLQYWIDNEHRALEDSPLPLLDKFRELQASGEHYCMIATARIWCELSKEYARMHGITGAVVARRDRSDNRGGAHLKVIGIRRLLNLRQFRAIDEIHVYEDNPTYLRDICDGLRGLVQYTVPHFIPSNQGH